MIVCIIYILVTRWVVTSLFPLYHTSINYSDQSVISNVIVHVSLNNYYVSRTTFASGGWMRRPSLHIILYCECGALPSSLGWKHHKIYSSCNQFLAVSLFDSRLMHASQNCILESRYKDGHEFCSPPEMANLFVNN